MERTSRKRTRSPRYAVPNNERAMISIGAERLAGTLRVLSLTGGMLRLPKRVAPGTFADITVNTVSGVFTAVIELLSAAGGDGQPFRFIHLDPTAVARLQDSILRLQQQEQPNAYAKPVQKAWTLATGLLKRAAFK